MGTRSLKKSPMPRAHSKIMAFDLGSYLEKTSAAVNAALDGFLPRATEKPATLHKAMRYSLFAGGKRMRPALCLAAAEACGGAWAESMPLACAVECIHTYSLIHDDLPATDDDDFRRGKPTNHKVFAEAIAILAGDALLTQAFEIAEQCKSFPRYPHRTIILEITRAAGSLKLIAGQVADLEAEGKSQIGHTSELQSPCNLVCRLLLEKKNTITTECWLSQRPSNHYSHLVTF